MTSEIPVQCSSNWAIKPTKSWSRCEPEFVIFQQMMKKATEYLKIIYIWNAETDVKTTIIAVISQLNSCENKAWKNSTLNGIWPQDLCNSGVVLHQLSYRANRELVTLWGRIYSYMVKKMRVNIWNIKWFELRERYEDINDHPSNIHNNSSEIKERNEKVHAWRGFEPMTSDIFNLLMHSFFFLRSSNIRFFFSSLTCKIKFNKCT